MLPAFYSTCSDLGGTPRLTSFLKCSKDDDLLSEKALALGPLPYLEREAMWAIGRAPESDDAAEAVRTAKAIKAAEFSCTVLAPVP